jgi:tight adherence protein B
MTTVLIIAFVATFSLSLLLFGESARRRRRVMSQMDRIVSGRLTRRSRELQSLLQNTTTEVKGLSGRLAALIDRYMAGRESAGVLETRLRQAGWKVRPSEFVVFTLTAGLIGLIVGLAIAPEWLVRIPIVLIGACIPYVSLVQRIGTRRKAIESQLVDALSMMANALRSGYSFLQSMEVAVHEMPQPISGEFDQVLRECRVNITIDEALNNLVVRTGSADLDMAVTAINIQRQVGGNLGEVLDTVSSTIRERLRLRGEVRTMTAQQRYSAFIVGALPIVLILIMWLMNPSYIRPMFTSTGGRLALVLCAILELIGSLIIRKLIQFEI